MDSSDLTIFTAVRLEAIAVAKALRMPFPSPSRPAVKQVHGLRVSLHLIGIAARDLPDIETHGNPACLAMIGLAGALDPELLIGQVIVGDCPARLDHFLPDRRRAICTTASIVATPEDKARLRESTGASAVDMETDIVRQWARARGVDFVSIRAISDTATQSLDAGILEMVDPWGRAQPVAIAAWCIRHPNRLGELIRLGAASKRAGQALGLAASELCKILASVNGSA